MSVTSHIIVHDPVNADDLFAAALAVVRLPVTGKGWQRSEVSDIGILSTKPRQGADAHVTVQFTLSGALLPEDEDDPEPSGYARLSFRTGGGRSPGFRRLHEGLVGALGQWLTARQLEWSRQYDEDNEESVWVVGYLKMRPHASA